MDCGLGEVSSGRRPALRPARHEALLVLCDISEMCVKSSCVTVVLAELTQNISDAEKLHSACGAMFRAKPDGRVIVSPGRRG